MEKKYIKILINEKLKYILNIYIYMYITYKLYRSLISKSVKEQNVINLCIRT